MEDDKTGAEASGGGIIIALFYLLCIFQEYSKKKRFFLGYSLTNLYFCTRKLEKV